jgi:nicotinic acid phosphoribosyltransferase
MKVYAQSQEIKKIKGKLQMAKDIYAHIEMDFENEAYRTEIMESLNQFAEMVGNPPVEINGKLIKTQLLRKPVIQAIEYDVSPFSPNNVMVSTSGYYAAATGITTSKKLQPKPEPFHMEEPREIRSKI